MRFVSIARLKDGMRLAQPVYGSKFEVLLTLGTELNKQRIDRINELGYPGVYIEDAMSDEAVVREVIPMEMRLNVVRAAQEFLQQAQLNPRERMTARITRDRQEKVILPVINKLIDNQRRIVDAVDLKPYENYSFHHAANVVVLSLLLGLRIGMSGVHLFELGMAALLHDIGNVFIPKAILDKPGKLSQEEFDLVKSHSERGFEYLRDNYDISIEACLGALQHHEHYDGSGYPNRLKKDKISIYGRIIALTDVYDALVSRRPFREPMYPYEAMEIIREKAGTMFDPGLVGEFEHVVALYPTGFCVELGTGALCLVVENHPRDTTRPRLKLINSMSKTALYVDLLEDPAFRETRIKRVVEL